jgi:hypothetical protein
MMIPEYITSRWVASLGDDQLTAAEAKLFTVFRRQESAEKSRAGARYVLLQGPPALVTAWHRWLLVNNEARQRGLAVRRT